MLLWTIRKKLSNFFRIATFYLKLEIVSIVILKWLFTLEEKKAGLECNRKNNPCFFSLKVCGEKGKRVIFSMKKKGQLMKRLVEPVNKPFLTQCVQIYIADQNSVGSGTELKTKKRNVFPQFRWTPNKQFWFFMSVPFRIVSTHSRIWCHICSQVVKLWFIWNCGSKVTCSRSQKCDLSPLLFLFCFSLCFFCHWPYH